MLKHKQGMRSLVLCVVEHIKMPRKRSKSEVLGNRAGQNVLSIKQAEPALPCTVSLFSSLLLLNGTLVKNIPVHYILSHDGLS